MSRFAPRENYLGELVVDIVRHNQVIECFDVFKWSVLLNPDECLPCIIPLIIAIHETSSLSLTPEIFERVTSDPFENTPFIENSEPIPSTSRDEPLDLSQPRGEVIELHCNSYTTPQRRTVALKTVGRIYDRETQSFESCSLEENKDTSPVVPHIIRRILFGNRTR